MPIGFMLAFTAIGLLLVALALPLIQRRIKPNGLYGLRVPATFADEWVWYEANAKTGRDFVVFGAIQIAVALLLPILRLPDEIYVLSNAAVLLGGALFVAIVGWKRANRLLATRARGPEARA